MAAIGSLLLALGAVVVLPVALSYLGLQDTTDLLFRLARWPLLLAVVVIGLPCSTATGRAGGSRAGNGSVWAAFSPQQRG